MKNGKAFLLALVALILLAGFGSCSEDDRPVTVRGRVYESGEDKSPVMAALVYVYTSDMSTLVGSAVTQIDGSYELEVPGDDNYVIVLNHTTVSSSKDAGYLPAGSIFELDFGIPASEYGTIKGKVTDYDSGKPKPNLLVEIYSQEEPKVPFASLKTDENGYYESKVPAGVTYSIYVRTSGQNPKQVTPFVQAGSEWKMNFVIAEESNISVGGADEGTLILIILLLAALVFGSILLDQVYFRRQRMKKLEQARVAADSDNEVLIIADPLEELERLKKEKYDIEYRIGLSKSQFHQRKLDEESFREIVRDYQKRLIDIESRIKNLEWELKNGKP